MATNIKFLLVILFVINSFATNAQQYNPLKIGDKMPDITIKNFYNEPRRSEKISSLYKNKLLILDFWGTWCGACLEELPKYNNLKKKFGNKIQIVAVGYEPREKLTTLFKRNPSLNSTLYLTIYGDSILTKFLFPHKSVPHVAWIDQNGKVIGITAGDKVTDKNISDILSGRSFDVRTKKDNVNFGIDAINKPYHLKDTDFISRSILTKGIPGGLSFDGFRGGSDDEPAYYFHRAFMGNLTIYDLYWDALFFGRRVFHNSSVLQFEIKDSLKYFNPKSAPVSFKNSVYKDYDNWADSNLYVYDLVLPKRVGEFTMKKYMLDDLNRSLNMNGRYEMREIDCWVLSKSTLAQYSNPLDSMELRQYYYRKAVIKTLDAKELTELLNSKIIKGVVVNGLTDNKEFNLTLNTSLHYLNIEQLNRIFSTLGLKLEKERRKVQMYIVSEY
jgi:thiol-disulfide isomerase/thioredoxin